MNEKIQKGPRFDPLPGVKKLDEIKSTSILDETIRACDHDPKNGTLYPTGFDVF